MTTLAKPTFIERALRIHVRHAHLDLRYILKRLGYSGGLKACERKLGVGREGVEDVDGFMAVLLWREYRKGNERALETLLAYNAADAVNLEADLIGKYVARLAAGRSAGSLSGDLTLTALTEHGFA